MINNAGPYLYSTVIISVPEIFHLHISILVILLLSGHFLCQSLIPGNFCLTFYLIKFQRKMTILLDLYCSLPWTFNKTRNNQKWGTRNENLVVENWYNAISEHQWIRINSILFIHFSGISGIPFLSDWHIWWNWGCGLCIWRGTWTWLRRLYQWISGITLLNVKYLYKSPFPAFTDSLPEHCE